MGKDALQGTLDLLILKTLACGPAHGNGITCSILAASDNQLRVEGSLYPALRRLESAGLIKAEWEPSDNNRRVGERHLAGILKRWRQHTAAVEAFLDWA